MLNFFKKASKLNLLIVFISVFLLIELFITKKLWVSFGREFPTISVIEQLPFNIPEWLDLGLYVLGIFLLLLIIILPKRRFLLNLFFVWAGFMVLMDVNRLQPWFYQYILMIWVAGNSSKKLESESSVFATIRLIVIATYFWSGINKLNIHFGEEVFPWLMSGIPWLQSLGQYSVLGYGIGVFEILLGLSFLAPRLWRYAVPLAVVFHSLIFIFLGPLGHNWNIVIWPWNIAMIVTVILLFPTRFIINPDLKDQTFSIRRYTPFFAILLLLGILPALSFFNLWDKPLSMTMYSGMNNEVTFYLPKDEVVCLPKYSVKTERIVDGLPVYTFNIDDWSEAEMGVPCYGTSNIYKRLGKQLCSCITNKSQAGLLILEPEGRWSKALKLEQLKCNQINK